MNKKDRNSLVQYYKTFRPADYKNERLDPREVFYIEVIEALADLYLKRQRKFAHQTLVLKSDEVMKLAWRIAGYLEDVVNQVGIFKALTTKNREIFGTPIFPGHCRVISRGAFLNLSLNLAILKKRIAIIIFCFPTLLFIRNPL